MTRLATRTFLAGLAAMGFPPHQILTLTAPPYGGWTQIPEARAIYYNGKTYFAYINGSNGNAEIRTYTHATAAVSAATVLHSALNTPADTHDCPGIVIRASDHRIIVAYSAHNGAQLYVRVSTNAEDISSFATEETLHTTIGGTAYTYPILIQRTSESGAPIYLFFRDFQGGTTSVLCYTKATDVDGGNWSTLTELYKNAGKTAYWKITSDGLWRIDFVVTDWDPSQATCSIYHFYSDASGYHLSDGSGLGSPRYDAADLTLVYDTASHGPAWPTDAYLDGSNNPRFVYNVNGSGDSSFYYAKWTGSAWTLSQIVASVGAAIVDPGPVASLNPVTTDCYLVKKISGKFEIWRYVTGDSGATWTGAAVTSTSTVDNLYPMNVKNHAAVLATLWMAGTYVGAETSFSMGILGIGD